MTDRIWILGAPDPEIAAIEALLRECGEHVAYALDAPGKRVTPATAYQPAALSVTEYLGDRLDVFAVECDGLGGLLIPLASATTSYVIDHHRPGDGMEPPQRGLFG